MTGAVERGAFLTDLAVKSNAASSIRNHAPNAIVFYRQILRKGFGWLEGIARVKKPARLLVIFARDQERAVLAPFNEVRCGMTSRLRGFGLRLMEDAGGASGISIRTGPPPAIPVATTSSLVNERSAGSSMPPWHRPSWAPVGRCLVGSALLSPSARDDGVSPLHAAGRALLCHGRHRLGRRHGRRGFGGPADARDSSRLMLLGAASRSLPGGPRSCDRSGGCRRPGRIVKLRSAGLFAASLFYRALLARFPFDFGPTPEIACIVDHRQDMHQIASNRVEHAIRKSR